MCGQRNFAVLILQIALDTKITCLQNRYISIAKTYILGAESLDFIVSKWHQVSQGDREITNGHGIIHIVRPVLLTLALVRE